MAYFLTVALASAAKGHSILSASTLYIATMDELDSATPAAFVTADGGGIIATLSIQ